MNGPPSGAKRVGLGVGLPGLGVAPRVPGLSPSGSKKLVAPLSDADLDGDLPSSQQDQQQDYDAAQQEEDWKKYGANLLDDLNMDLSGGGGGVATGFLAVPRIGAATLGSFPRVSTQCNISQSTPRVGPANTSAPLAPVAPPAPVMPLRHVTPPKVATTPLSLTPSRIDPRQEAAQRPGAPQGHAVIGSQQKLERPPNLTPTQQDLTPSLPVQSTPQRAPVTQPHFVDRNRAVNSTQDLASILQRRPPAAPRSEPMMAHLFSQNQEKSNLSAAGAAPSRAADQEDQFFAPPAAKRAKPNPKPNHHPNLVPPPPQQQQEFDDVDSDLARDIAAANFSLIRKKPNPPPQEIPGNARNSGPPAPTMSTAASSSSSSSAAVSDGRRILPGPVGALPPRTTFQKEELDRSIDGVGLLQNIFGNPNNNNNGNAPGAAAAAAPAAEQHVSRNAENDHDFRSGPWVYMINAYKLVPLGPNKLKYSISWLQSDGYMSKTKQLVVLVKLFQQIDEEASAILRDPTGEITATVHSRVIEKYPYIQDGCVLVLEDVASLSEATKSHHLIITDLNVKNVFPQFYAPPEGTRLPKRFEHLNIYEEAAHPKQEELDEADHIANRSGLFEMQNSSNEEEEGEEVPENSRRKSNVAPPELPGNLDFLTLDKKPMAITGLGLNPLSVSDSLENPGQEDPLNATTSAGPANQSFRGRGGYNQGQGQGRGNWRSRGGGGGGSGGGRGRGRGQGRGGGGGGGGAGGGGGNNNEEWDIPPQQHQQRNQGVTRSPAPWEMDSPPPPFAGPKYPVTATAPAPVAPVSPPPWQQPKRPPPQQAQQQQPNPNLAAAAAPPPPAMGRVSPNPQNAPQPQHQHQQQPPPSTFQPRVNPPVNPPPPQSLPPQHQHPAPSMPRVSPNLQNPHPPPPSSRPNPSLPPQAFNPQNRTISPPIQQPRMTPAPAPVNAATARVLQSTMSPPPGLMGSGSGLASPGAVPGLVSGLSHATGNLGGVSNFTRRANPPVFNSTTQNQNQTPNPAFQKPPT